MVAEFPQDPCPLMIYSISTINTEDDWNKDTKKRLADGWGEEVFLCNAATAKMRCNNLIEITSFQQNLAKCLQNITFVHICQSYISLFN